MQKWHKGLVFEDLERRQFAWRAISGLWLDDDSYESNSDKWCGARRLLRSDYSAEELELIFHYELSPLLWPNAIGVAGTWGYFDGDWLQDNIQEMVQSPFHRFKAFLTYHVFRFRRGDWNDIMDRFKRLEADPDLDLSSEIVPLRMSSDWDFVYQQGPILIRALRKRAKRHGDLHREHLIFGPTAIDIAKLPPPPAIDIKAVCGHYMKPFRRVEYPPHQRAMATALIARFLFALGVDERQYPQLPEILSDYIQEEEALSLTLIWLDLLNWVFGPATMDGSAADLRRREILRDYPRRLGVWNVLYHLFRPDYISPYVPETGFVPGLGIWFRAFFNPNDFHKRAPPIESLLALGYSVKELNEIKYHEANAAMVLCAKDLDEIDYGGEEDPDIRPILKTGLIKYAGFYRDTRETLWLNFELFELFIWLSIRTGRSHWKDALNMRLFEKEFEKEWLRLRLQLPWKRLWRRLRAKQK